MAKGRSWLRWAGIAAAPLVALALAVPYLAPLDYLIPELARVASDKLRQPVTISALSLHLLPTPRAVAHGISIGRRSEVTIAELEIVPDLISLVQGTRTIRLIRAERVELQEAALGFPGKMPKAGQGEPVNVERVLLKQVQLRHSTLKLPEFELDLRMGEGLSVERLDIDSRDVTVTIDIEPEGVLAARYKLHGRAFGGTLSANARAEGSKQLQWSGKASLSDVDLVGLQRAFGKKAQLSGRLHTDATFSARGRSADQLADALQLEGPFEILSGVYQGVDLAKAGDLTAERAEGDVTRFDEFKGQLQMQGKQVKISELCVRSPKLTAGGNVEIADEQKLTGKLLVSMAKTGGFVGVPVTLSGTTADPVVRPSRAYIAGAVVGTLLLPGIGTGLGASAASAFEGASVCK